MTDLIMILLMAVSVLMLALLAFIMYVAFSIAYYFLAKPVFEIIWSHIKKKLLEWQIYGKDPLDELKIRRVKDELEI